MKTKVLRVVFVVVVFYLGTLFGGMSRESTLENHGKTGKIGLSASRAMAVDICGAKLEVEDFGVIYPPFPKDGKCGYRLNYKTASGQGYGVPIELPIDWTK